MMSQIKAIERHSIVARSPDVGVSSARGMETVPMKPERVRAVASDALPARQDRGRIPASMRKPTTNLAIGLAQHKSGGDQQ
jgi:hypothetical protein